MMGLVDKVMRPLGRLTIIPDKQLVLGGKFMGYVLMWGLFGALIGSFGTAFIHERTGRDVQMGGLIGAAVGAFGSVPLLVILWLWLYYGDGYSRPIGRVYGRPRRVWYRWWD